VLVNDSIVDLWNEQPRRDSYRLGVRIRRLRGGDLHGKDGSAATQPRGHESERGERPKAYAFSVPRAELAISKELSAAQSAKDPRGVAGDCWGPATRAERADGEWGTPRSLTGVPFQEGHSATENRCHRPWPALEDTWSTSVRIDHLSSVIHHWGKEYTLLPSYWQQLDQMLPLARSIIKPMVLRGADHGPSP